LILDEPTSGLDPIVRRGFLEAIVNLLKNADRTVFFSTHILSDIERVADRLIVLSEGQVAENDGIESLRGRFTKASFVFSDPPSGDLAIPGARKVEKGAREWVAIFTSKSDSEIHHLANDLGAADCLIIPMSLEDIFIELIRDTEESAEC